MSNDASVSSANFDSDTGLGVDSDSDNPIEGSYSMAPTTESKSVTQNDEPSETKVYYYCDKEETPYLTSVEVPPSKLTLGAFKTQIAKPGRFKYFNCCTDDANVDVKVEIKEDSGILKPSSQGIITVYLVTDETAPMTTTAASAVQMRPHARSSHSHQRVSQRVSSKYSGGYRQRRTGSHRNVSADDSTIREPTYFFPEQRAYSDDESSVVTDFTSVSQQRDRQVRRRRGRKKAPPAPRRPSPSFLSTTVSDASMCVDLITVAFDLSVPLPLGIIVVSQWGSRGEDSGIYVSEVAPNSLVARDGRIRPGMLILEVNDYQLADFPPDQAVDLLRQAANPRNGVIKLTCAQTERERFIPPNDTVMPINTQKWVEQTTAMNRQLKPIAEDMESLHSPMGVNLVYNPGCLNAAGGFPSSGVGSSIASDSTDFPLGANTTRHYKQQPKRFRQHDKDVIAVAMASTSGGLEQRHKVSGKKCFSSDDMVDWLRRSVEGLEETKRCEKFATELVKEGLIAQTVDKTGFSRTTCFAFTDKVKALHSDRRILAVVNGQKPMLDETLPQTSGQSKGFAARIKKLFCVNPKTLRTPLPQTTSSTGSTPSFSDENSAPHSHNNYVSAYHPRHYPSTHIP